MKPSELPAKPEAWTRNANARTATGVEVNPHDKDAVCWCLWESLAKCGVAHDEATIVKLRAAIVMKYGTPSGNIMMFNDIYADGHADVLTVLKDADL